MYVHEQIIEAMGKIQRKYDLNQSEVVAEMAQAIHVMLTFNTQDVTAMLNHIQEPSLNDELEGIHA